MKMSRIYLLFLAVMFACTAVFADNGSHGMHPKKQIAYVKQQLKLGKEPFVTAFKQLRAKADSALTVSTHAVEDYSVPGYYVKKEEHIKQSFAMQIDGFAAYSCALTWALTGEQKYAAKAEYLLNSWATVNKKCSQLDGALVMSYSGMAFMVAAELLKDDKKWSATDQQQFATWTRTVFREATNSIRFRNNNSGDWSRLASILADVYLDDRKDLDENIRLTKKDIFDKIAPDGHMVEEIKRQANGIWYTYFSLAPLTAACWVIYNETGENLFFAEKDGASIKKALDYLLYYDQHPDEWKYFKNPVVYGVDSRTGIWPYNLLEAMNGIYHSKDFDDFVAPKRPIIYPIHNFAWAFPTLMPLSLNGYK